MENAREGVGDTQVFILAGGLGTRLQGVTSRPKAILPVAGRPFVAWTLGLLRAQGFERVHFLLGVGAEEVEAHLDEVARASGFPRSAFSCSIETTRLDTGGALSSAMGYARDLNLVLNADSFSAADYAALVAGHEGVDWITLLAVWQEDRSDYGGLVLDAEGRVSSFLEKGTAGPGWINAGAYVMDGPWIAALPGGPSSLEREHLPRVAAAGRLRAHPARVFFRDIGTPERLAAAEVEFTRFRDTGRFPSPP